MNDVSMRFSLRPITEKTSQAELRVREESYLQQANIGKELFPPPNRDLELIVVIPAYNEEASIRQTIDSLLLQKFPPQSMEIIIVNNGSTDRTRAIVEEYLQLDGPRVLLTEEPVQGCLQAVKTGMDLALFRLSQVLPPSKGLIASIDADHTVNPSWAEVISQTVAKRRVDMLRGKTRVVPPIEPAVEALLKEVFDLGNRANAYTELARLRLREALSGCSHPELPLWLPRITGPNIAITRSAYVAVGGMDPRDSGDQASHLANPLLRQGGIFLQSIDPGMILNISPRNSQRIRDTEEFLGIARFGGVLEMVSASVHCGREIHYPNPAGLEFATNSLLKGIHCDIYEAKVKASSLLALPSSPSILYQVGTPLARQVHVSLAEARQIFLQMTTKLGGIDYRAAESFLFGREHLRNEVLTLSDGERPDEMFIERFIKRAGAPFQILPKHLIEIDAALRNIIHHDLEEWYNNACCCMEEIYAEL